METLGKLGQIQLNFDYYSLCWLSLCFALNVIVPIPVFFTREFLLLHILFFHNNMNFKINLKAGARLKKNAISNKKYLRIEYIVHILCDALQVASSEFLISACDLSWPVDVRTDFCIFLENLPNALNACEKFLSFTINFYEQGIECEIEFEPSGDGYIVSCKSWGQAVGTQEIIGNLQLFTMLCGIRDQFVTYIVTEMPSIAAHPLVVKYFKDLKK